MTPSHGSAPASPLPHSYDKAHYGDRWADIYDEDVPPQPEVVAFLARHAGKGPVLELAIGTGRFAVPLTECGVRVEGIDASAAMVRKLHERAPKMRVEIGDMATVEMRRSYPLVFLVATSLFLLLEQDDQVRCFENAAHHLTKKGRFVVHTWTPSPSRFTDGQTVRTADVSESGVSIEASLHDAATQRIDVQYVSISGDGGVELYPIRLRYAWPAELDLMARLAGLRLLERHGGWRGEPFRGDSPEHVSIYGRA